MAVFMNVAFLWGLCVDVAVHIDDLILECERLIPFVASRWLPRR